MKRIYFIPLVLSLIVFLISCGQLSGDLSRSKAESILSKQKIVATGAIPSQMDIYDVYNGGEIRYRNDNDTKQKRQMLETLQNTGYVSLQLRQETGTYFVTPTDKLRLFMYEQNQIGPIRVVVGDVKVDNITGITTAESDPNARIVEYTVKFIPNELSKLVPMEDDAERQINKTIKAYFRKYDDGWRLEN